jgi:hypothetical protein
MVKKGRQVSHVVYLTQSLHTVWLLLTGKLVMALSSVREVRCDRGSRRAAYKFTQPMMQPVPVAMPMTMTMTILLPVPVMQAVSLQKTHLLP